MKIPYLLFSPVSPSSERDVPEPDPLLLLAHDQLWPHPGGEAAVVATLLALPAVEERRGSLKDFSNTDAAPLSRPGIVKVISLSPPGLYCDLAGAQGVGRSRGGGGGGSGLSLAADEVGGPKRSGDKKVAALRNKNRM